MNPPIEIDLTRTVSRGELVTEVRLMIKVPQSDPELVDQAIAVFREISGLPDAKPTESPNVD